MPQLQDVIPNGIHVCVALYDNIAETPNELSFKSGDLLTVVQEDSPGLEGWWICSLRGQQGICPSNRLRLMSESELNLLRDRKRRSWNNQTNKMMGGGGGKPGIEMYQYDLPAASHSTPGEQQASALCQYDVPLNPSPAQQSQGGEESYDVPKPVTGGGGGSLVGGGGSLVGGGGSLVGGGGSLVGGGGSLTPSSSISSLTTDSNRSSLIQQDYDVPRPTRLQPTQEEETLITQGWYDVPKSGAVGSSSRSDSLPPAPLLDLDSALDWLGRLEAGITGASSRLLACAGPHWRSPARLQPRLLELRAAVSSLSTSLHQLTLFVQPILLSVQDKGLGPKLSTLFETLVKSDVKVRENSAALECLGWTTASLGVEDEGSHSADPLDHLVSTAALLTDDIRQIASFIQGNSTLLFKKLSPGGGRGSGGPPDLSYINLEKKKKEDEDEAEEGAPLPPLPQTTLQDRKLLDFYLGECRSISGCLLGAIDSLLLTVTQNQPPQAFLCQSKAVISWAHKLVGLGDALERNLSAETRLRAEVYAATNSLGDATSNVVHKTKSAALHFPSVTAVQYMVDSVVDLSHKSKALKQVLLAY